MDLPAFNPQGSGPQGTGDIPPEKLLEAGRRAGVDLIGASLKPEDSPAAQEILDREAQGLVAQLGIQQPAEAPQQPTAAAPSPAPAAQPQPQPAPAPAPPSVDIAKKVGEILTAYKGTFDPALAASRPAPAPADPMSQLQQRVIELESQLASALTPRPREPELPSRAPAAAAPPPEGQPAGDFWQNPEQAIDSIVQKNILAYHNEVAKQQEEQRAAEFRERNAADFERLRPLMRELYVKDREAYDSIPVARGQAMLLERAREREKYIQAVQFYQQINGLQGGEPSPAPNGNGQPQSLGSLPQAGVSGRAAAAPAATGDWSNTPAMKRLWRSNDGSIDETRSLMDILKERGHGENITVY